MEKRVDFDRVFLFLAISLLKIPYSGKSSKFLLDKEWWEPVCFSFIRYIHFWVHVGRSNAVYDRCWTKNPIPQYWFSCGRANNYLAGFFVVVRITPLTVRPKEWVKPAGQELPVCCEKCDLNPISFMIGALVQSVCM